MSAAEPFALYVHVPYCRHVCPYCDFNVLAAATPPERDYVAAVAAELAAYGADAHWSGRPLRSVYFGGGTPSLFTPGAIADVLAAAAAHFAFGADTELTLEANPDTVVPE
ncbi:MAG: coproporphyrinogen III oxidase family protein, partial [Deltaproteobacteria bacterium]